MICSVWHSYDFCFHMTQFKVCDTLLVLSCKFSLQRRGAIFKCGSASPFNALPFAERVCNPCRDRILVACSCVLCFVMRW